MRTLVAAGVTALCLSLCAQAFAQTNSSGLPLTVDSSIAELLSDSAAREVLSARLPNFVDNPAIGQIDEMSLRALHAVSPEAITDAKLEEIAIALAAAPTGQRSSGVRSAGLPAGVSAADTSIGDLLDNGSSREILARELPELVNTPDIARLRSVPLRALSQLAPQAFSGGKLERIEAALTASRER